MADFKTFKRRRLREDPTAANYNDYQWERAFAAYCSARGIEPKKAGGEDEGKRPAPAEGTEASTADSGGTPRPFVPIIPNNAMTLRPLAYASLVAAFFFSVLLGFLVPYGFGADLLIGFLLGATYFISHTCLVFMLLAGLEQR